MIEVLLGFGYVGLFIACFISGTVIPFSSDIILITLVVAGWDYALCLAIATAGNGSGGMINYYLGRLGKIDRIEKYSNIKHEKIMEMKDKMQNKPYMSFFSWIPIIGNIMVIALGYLRANTAIVAICLYAGKGVRYAIIIFLTLQGIELIN